MRIIQGDTNPKAEQRNLYQLNPMTSSFNASPFTPKTEIKYTWTLYKFSKNQWRQVSGNIKYGEKNYYQFGQAVVGIPFKIQVHAEERNILNIIENKLVAELTVVPKTAKEPTIGRVILLNRNNTDVNKASFNEQLTAQARTSNMLNKEIAFYLWEEGASEFEKYRKPKKTKVKKGGIAEVKFNLSEYASPQTWMSFMQPGSKATKKFFVTAVYENEKTTNKTAVSATNIQQPNATKQQSATTIPPDNTTNILPKAKDPGVLSKTKEVFAEGLKSIIEFLEGGVSTAQVKQQPEPKTAEKEKCFCNRDFESEEFEKIIQGLRNSEPNVKKNYGYVLFSAKNCEIPLEDRSVEKLRIQINKLFKKYDINSCLRKIHFLSQIYHETDRLYTTKEYADGIKYDPGVHNDAISSGNTEKGDGEKFKGRGLMQLTWKNNYKIYKYFSGIDVVTNYQLISDSLYYACDSAGWYWKQGKILGISDRWKGPANPPSYVKIHKPNYPKTTIKWKDNSIEKKYGTIDLGLIADDDKVDLISYLVNGGSNGLNERRNYVNTLKLIFEYPQKCVNKKNSAATSPDESKSVTIRLVRKWQTTKSTIGEFTIDNTSIKGYILEEKGPDTTTSGIEQRVPIGTYNLEWHHGTKIKKGLKLFNDAVSKDRAILIHSGNTADDTEGCLLPGSTKTKDFVGGSKDKLKEIFDYVEEIGIKDAKIIITQNYE